MNFSGVEQAIRFAFNIQRRVEYAAMDLLRVSGTDGESLSPQELHAQSAMILAKIEKLKPIQTSAVYAGLGYGIQRDVAIHALAVGLQPNLREAVPGTQQTRDCLSNWIKKTPPVRQIAKDYGVSYRKVMEWRRAVLDAYQPVYLQAIDALEDEMFGVDGFGVK